MKKKILGSIAILAIAAVAALNVNFSTSNDLSGISLTNVEALASSEDPPVFNCPGGWTICVAINNGTWFFKS